MKKNSKIYFYFFFLFVFIVTACSNEEMHISEAKLSRAVQTGGFEDVGTTFKQTDEIFFFRIKVANVKENVTLKAVWHVVKVAVSEPMQLGETEFVVVPPNEVANFQFGIADLWPEGDYKVELFVNNTLERTVEFQVEK
jgi:hypothetical protein